MSNYPEGTKRVFTSVDPRKIDIVDKGANLQVLVYKRKDQDMTKEKASEEKPEVVETEAVKAAGKGTSEKETTKTKEVSKSESSETPEPEARETVEVLKASLSEADIEAIAVKMVELQKQSKTTEPEKAEPEAKEITEVSKSEAPDAEAFGKALEAALAKAVKPLTDKITALEEERGGSATADGEEVEVEKSEGSVFDGLFSQLPR